MAEKSPFVSPAGHLFIVSAPSGAGKSTLCRVLTERLPALRYSISTTTRSPREGEVDGVDYFFTDVETFKAGIQVLGLKEDGVGYAMDDNNKALVTAEMQAAVEKAKADIIAGTVKVHDYMSDNKCPVE